MHARNHIALLISNLVIFSLLLAACSPAQSTPIAETGGEAQPPERLNLVATTTIVADVVRNIAGEHADLSVLIPAGVDEHGFEPTPRDIANVSEAGSGLYKRGGLGGIHHPPDPERWDGGPRGLGLGGHRTQ
jgi:ABC-type Zn uptake system ZnuABC Zn-binding protein ZnuA